MENNNENLNFDLMGIQKCQRNRYPILFVDKMVEVIKGKSAHGVKNFTYNEWFFPAHFDDEPSVPGFIQIESLVQTFLMTFLSFDEYKGKKTSFVSINNVKFKKKIEPGDRLDIYATLESFKRGIAKGHVESFVGDKAACSAEFVVVINDVFNQFMPKNK